MPYAVNDVLKQSRDDYFHLVVRLERHSYRIAVLFERCRVQFQSGYDRMAGQYELDGC